MSRVVRENSPISRKGGQFRWLKHDIGAPMPRDGFDSRTAHHNKLKFNF